MFEKKYDAICFTEKYILCVYIYTHTVLITYI